MNQFFSFTFGYGEGLGYFMTIAFESFGKASW